MRNEHTQRTDRSDTHTHTTIIILSCSLKYCGMHGRNLIASHSRSTGLQIYRQTETKMDGVLTVTWYIEALSLSLELVLRFACSRCSGTVETRSMVQIDSSLFRRVTNLVRYEVRG